MMRVWYVPCVLVLFITVACSADEPETLGRADSLEGVELQDFRNSFDSAACVCQSLLLERAGDLTPDDIVDADDALLARFAFNHSSNPTIYCARFDDERVITRLSDPGVNGCHSVSDDLERPTNVSNGNAEVRLADGFCRADFNRCLAAELESRSASLASAPRSRAVRDALLAEARLRLQTSVLELSSALGQYADGCGAEDWAVEVSGAFGRRYEECSLRLESTDYAQHSINRLSEGAMRLGEMLEREAHAAALTADALSPGTAESPQAYVEAFWGRDGARMSAAEALMGTLDDDIIYGHADASAAYFPEVFDGMYADRVARDERVAVALGLLVEHEIPIPMVTFFDFRLPLPQLEADPSAFYNLLDHRLAFVSRTSPYDLGRITDEEWAMDPVPLPSAPDEIDRHAAMSWAEFSAYAGRPLPLDDSPLRHFYGIEPVHVGAALAMMRNQLDTMDVEYRTRDQVIFGGSYAMPAVRPLTLRPRDPRHLAASLLNIGEAPRQLYGDPLAVFPQHGELSGQIYSYDPSLVRDLGGALALHVVRIHLARLAANPRGRDWLGAGALPEARALLTSYVGDSWVEYKRHADYTCPPSPFGHVCPGSPVCPTTAWGGYLCQDGVEPTASPLVGVAHVDLYFDPSRTDFARDPDGDGVQDGSVVIVRRREEAYCLQYGHRPDGSDVGCGAVPRRQLREIRAVDFESDQRQPALERIGYEQRRFELSRPEGYPLPSEAGAFASIYVLFRSGPRAAPAEGATYQLIDVIQPRRQASVHPLGGRFIEMLADGFATEPHNPGRPAVAALGLAYDMVPPLEHELISDGDGFEDSYQTYLTNADAAATSATRQLQAARAFELSERLDARADAALLAEAEVAEAETVSEACGMDRGCDLDRREVITLGEIRVGGELIVTAPDPTEIPSFLEVLSDGRVRLRMDLGGSEPTRFTTCADHLATFGPGFDLSGVSKHDWDQYTETYLSAGLGCVRYLVQLAAFGAELRDVPEAVLAELAAGGSGEFRESSGEVRDALIAMFGDILGLREGMRSFQSMYTAAIAQVQSGANQIDILTTTGEEAFLCHLGQALAIVGAIVAAAVSTVVTFGAGAAALVAVIVVIAVAAVGAAAGAVGWVGAECEGDTRPARAQARTTFANTVIAMENLRGALDRVKQGAGAIARGDARIDRLQRRSELASQRRAIRARVAMTNAVSDLPEWHALQSYRVERARRSLTRAQQYAYIARRSVEYRFGLDLAVMNRSEPFVDAPAQWVNDLFVLDTASSADESTPGVDHVNTSGEAIADWVQQLGDFVRGYPFARRFRDGTDTQVLRIENLGLDTRTEPDGAFLYARMMFKCRDADGLLLAGQPLPSDPGAPWPSGEPCVDLGGVDYAELPFAIPSRLDGYVGRRLASGSYNYRHERIAFNVVGSAVVDCSRAERPWECYGDGNLEYSVRQDGLVFIENHDRELHSFMAEPGVILEGRALSAERVLTNPLSVADSALISPFERREFWGRPLMGSYVLRVHGRPEINWRYIEGFQMLLGYRYWTRQE